jgi:hypothetical protein
MEHNTEHKPAPEGWSHPLPEKLPQPTISPFVLSLGACLIAWGALTSWIITVAGLVLFAIGGAAWVERMRHD